MVETPPCLKPRSSSSTRLLLRPCVLTTSPLTWVCTRCKTPASESSLSSATVELKRLGTANVTLSVTTQGRAMMVETAFDWGPATTGRDKMEFVTWSATVSITTTMMEIVVTQRSLTFSRPALILSPLTGELNRSWESFTYSHCSAVLQVEGSRSVYFQLTIGFPYWRCRYYISLWKSSISQPLIDINEMSRENVKDYIAGEKM